MTRQRATLKTQRGSAATEYGLLVAFIAIVVVVGAGAFFQSASDWFGRLTAFLAGVF